jgi:hypothetical protein
LRFEREINGQQSQDFLGVRCGAQIRQRDAMRRVPFEKVRIIDSPNIHDEVPASAI